MYVPHTKLLSTHLPPPYLFRMTFPPKIEQKKNLPFSEEKENFFLRMTRTEGGDRGSHQRRVWVIPQGDFVACARARPILVDFFTEISKKINKWVLTKDFPSTRGGTQKPPYNPFLVVYIKRQKFFSNQKRKKLKETRLLMRVHPIPRSLSRRSRARACRPYL